MKYGTESLPELGRHDVVQNRVNGRVDIEHHTAEIEKKVIGFDTNDFKYVDYDEEIEIWKKELTISRG